MRGRRSSDNENEIMFIIRIIIVTVGVLGVLMRSVDHSTLLASNVHRVMLLRRRTRGHRGRRR